MMDNRDNLEEESRKLYCGNLDTQVDDELLYELFTQAGPVEKVSMPRDRNSGSSLGYAFIVFKHECSVPYALEIFEDTTLYGKLPKLRARRGATSGHQRSQSTPMNFMPNPAAMDFDSLLNMSRNMLNPMPMGMPMRSPMGMYRGPADGDAPMGPPGVDFPMEPIGPPGVDVPGEGEVVLPPGDAERNPLSQSSLQGNWSGRNASHMLPYNDRPPHHSRREYGHHGRGGYRGSSFDRGGNRYEDHDNYRSRDRSYEHRDNRDRNWDNRDRNYEHKDNRDRNRHRRSNDYGERRGRY